MELFLLFKPKLQGFIWVGLCLLLAQAANAQVSGTVFRDFNANGVKDNTASFNEPFVAGVTVTAYDAAGTPTATTTDASGAYSFTGLTLPLRIEFSGYQTGNYSAPKGTGNNTSVQFYTLASSSANFGINFPNDYCQSNPLISVVGYQTGSSISSTDPTLYTFSYNNSGTSPTPTADVEAQEIGSVWGSGYQKTTKRLFISAFLKRHAGFGPRGIDGVYIVDYSTATHNVIGGFDLQGVIPANGGAAIDLGSITRSNVASTISNGAAGDNQLPQDNTKASVDLDAFAKVGKIAYGDIDVSEDGNVLWMVNLNQRALIKIDISNLAISTTIPNTLSGALVNQYLLDDIANVPTCSNGTLRPFGLAFRNGKGYLGCVCDAASSATTVKPSELDGYVLSFDPNNPTAFTTELNFGFNYNREPAYLKLTNTDLVEAEWQKWMNTWTTSAINENSLEFLTAPQPIISDIEITPNGSMVLGVMDRFAHQHGNAQYRAISADRNTKSAISAGDILYAGLQGNSFVIELGENDTKSSPAGFLTNDGVNNTGEFFWADFYTGNDALFLFIKIFLVSFVFLGRFLYGQRCISPRNSLGLAYTITR